MNCLYCNYAMESISPENNEFVCHTYVYNNEACPIICLHLENSKIYCLTFRLYHKTYTLKYNNVLADEVFNLHVQSLKPHSIFIMDEINRETILDKIEMIKLLS